MMLTIASAALLLGGLAIELLGIMLMARPFVKVPLAQLPAVLFSALYKGEDAKAMVEIAELVGVRPLDFVQGLAFACLGLSLQFVGVAIEVGIRHWTPGLTH